MKVTTKHSHICLESSHVCLLSLLQYYCGWNVKCVSFPSILHSTGFCILLYSTQTTEIVFKLNICLFRPCSKRCAQYLLRIAGMMANDCDQSNNAIWHSCTVFLLFTSLRRELQSSQQFYSCSSQWTPHHHQDFQLCRSPWCAPAGTAPACAKDTASHTQQAPEMKASLWTYRSEFLMNIWLTSVFFPLSLFF